MPFLLLGGSCSGFRAECAHRHERSQRSSIGKSDRAVGRRRIKWRAPPDLIRFKAERGRILAVEISAESLSFLLADLNGNELDSLRIALTNRKTTPAAICSYIDRALQNLLRKQKKTREQLLVMVVGVPAIANVEAGSVLSVSTLEGWRAVALRAMLNKVVNCLVIIENDTNLAAQGEHYCGAAQTEQNFAFISIGANVGEGIFLGGRIHHGSQWSAGELPTSACLTSCAGSQLSMNSANLKLS